MNEIYILGDEGLSGEILIVEAHNRQEAVAFANCYMGYDEHYWEIIETSKSRRDIITKNYFEGLV